MLYFVIQLCVVMLSIYLKFDCLCDCFAYMHMHAGGAWRYSEQATDQWRQLYVLIGVTYTSLDSATTLSYYSLSHVPSLNPGTC